MHMAPRSAPSGSFLQRLSAESEGLKAGQKDTHDICHDFLLITIVNSRYVNVGDNRLLIVKTYIMIGPVRLCFRVKICAELVVPNADGILVLSTRRQYFTI